MQCEATNNSGVRRRGAPKGNKNALKHGIRSHELLVLRSSARTLIAGAKRAIAQSERTRRLQGAALRLQRLALMHEARKFIARIARESGCTDILTGNRFRRDLVFRLSSRRPSS